MVVDDIGLSLKQRLESEMRRILNQKRGRWLEFSRTEDDSRYEEPFAHQRMFSPPSGPEMVALSTREQTGHNDEGQSEITFELYILRPGDTTAKLIHTISGYTDAGDNIRMRIVSVDPLRNLVTIVTRNGSEVIPYL